MRRRNLAFDGGCIPPILGLVVDSLISLGEEDSALENQKSGSIAAKILSSFKHGVPLRSKFSSICLGTEHCQRAQKDAAPKTVRGVSPQGPSVVRCRTMSPSREHRET